MGGPPKWEGHENGWAIIISGQSKTVGLWDRRATGTGGPPGQGGHWDRGLLGRAGHPDRRATSTGGPPKWVGSSGWSSYWDGRATGIGKPPKWEGHQEGRVTGHRY